MRRLILPSVWLLALGWFVSACEPRTEPAAAPASRSEPEPAPTPASPTQAAESAPTPTLRSGEVAGIHYVEWITAGAEAEQRLPMIVAIHGLGDDPEHFAELLMDFDRPARLILPRAIDPYEGGGWSWFPIRARDNDVEGLAKGIDAAADRLAPAIRELSEQRPTKGKPIVLGFSQGGMLSFALAVEHGDAFAHAIPIGGWLPPPLWPKAKPESAPPITALHGDADKAVFLEPTREAVEHLRGLGHEVELEVYPGVGHAIPPEMRDELFRVLREQLASISAEAPTTDTNTRHD